MKNNTQYILIALAALFVGFVAGVYVPRWSMMGSYSMQGAMQGMMHGISRETGNDFDRAFLDEMIVHHEGAIEMAQMVRERSSRPELLKLADDIISTQSQEIDMMRMWSSAWFK